MEGVLAPRLSRASGSLREWPWQRWPALAGRGGRGEQSRPSPVLFLPPSPERGAAPWHVRGLHPRGSDRGRAWTQRPLVPRLRAVRPQGHHPGQSRALGYAGVFISIHRLADRLESTAPFTLNQSPVGAGYPRDLPAPALSPIMSRSLNFLSQTPEGSALPGPGETEGGPGA